jgi:multiple sugar transport system permease protein
MIAYPLIIKFSVSIRSYQDSLDPMVFFVPRTPSLANFKIAYQTLDYSKTALFSLAFCAMVSILQTFSCTLAAYSFGRFKYFGRNIIFGLSIITLSIPPQVLLLPLYIRFRYFNPISLFQLSGSFSGISLIDTAWPFILLSITAMGFKNGLYIYILRQYFINVPNVLDEAACIDGCGTWRIFYKIMLPGAIPMLVSVFLFSFVWQWNDYYYTAMLSPNLPLLTAKIFGTTSSILGGGADYWQSITASPKILLLMAPLVILYVFTQRYFVESIEKSGIVG